MDLKPHIAKVPNFPVDGVTFWDVTPLLQNAQALSYTIESLARQYHGQMIHKVAAPESRGFIFGCPLAKELHAGFVPIRKPGKLPREKIGQKFNLEYGTQSIEMHTDAIQKGEHVLLFDDVLATGGTAGACAKLVERQGGIVNGMCFLLELQYLSGRAHLERYNIFSLLQYTREDV